MSDSDDNLSNDYHINENYQRSNILPKVRSQTSSSSSSSSRKPSSNAVPATPRMLRNSSATSQQQIAQQYSQQSPQVQMQQYQTAPVMSPPQRSNSTRVQRTPSASARYNQYQTPINDYNTTESPSRQKLAPLDTQTAVSSSQRSSPQRNNRLLPAANVSNQDSQSTSSKPESTPSKRPPQGQFHRRSIGDWDFMKTVGAGSMGKVKLAKHRKTSEVCAIKIVPRAARIYERNHANDPPPQDESDADKRRKEYEKEVARDKRTIREASLGKILYHPFICRLFEVITMSNHYYMLFEYVSGGQMLDYIVSHGSLKERHARKFARGIASALDYLHKNNVVHRDLKIENIMISKTGDIKIIDFGLSNLYSNDSLLKTYCGSLYFAAPELLCAHPYIGPEVDVWSFGVVLYVLVCGKVPFDDQSVSALHEKIKKGKVEYPSFLSPEVMSLLARMLVVNPNKRAKLSEVLAHPWMTKGYENQPLSFVPHRIPLKLPLEPAIIKEMYSLELGESPDQIAQDLAYIISSDLYKEASKHWYQSQDTPNVLKVDPTTSFHPLVSIYYLVDEMLKRKRAKESIVDIPPVIQDYQKEIAQHEVLPQQEATLTQRKAPEIKIEEPIIPKGKYETPTQPPVLSFPEAAHTSPIHTSTPPLPDPQQVLSQETSAHEDLVIPQQHIQQTGSDEKGFNSLIRKFSQLRSKRPHEQPQRTNSVNVASSNHYNANEFNLNNKYQTFAQDQSLPNNRNSFETGGDKKSSELLTVTHRPATKSHARTVSAYVPTSAKPDANSPSSKVTSSAQPKKFHPSARAKSVGHRRDHPQYSNAHTLSSEVQQVPPLPTDLTDDAYFDDVTLDEFPNSDKATLVNSGASGTSSHTGSVANRRAHNDFSDLNEDQIIQEASKAPPGSMPSIEYPRTLFLKGFFSVQTTSTKSLPVIRANIISVLSKLDVQFTEVRGGFICQHVPSIKPLESPVKEETSLKSIKSTSDSSAVVPTTSDPSKGLRNTTTDSGGSFGEHSGEHSTPTSSTKSHKRMFSIGGSILGYRRKPSIGNSPAIPPTPVAASNAYNQYDFDSSASLDSLNNEGGHGGSDMLVSSSIEQNRVRAPSGNMTTMPSGNNQHPQPQISSVIHSRTPLKFEIHIVKVPLVGLFGVQFKKVMGNTWMYKALAGQILNELNL